VTPAWLRPSRRALLLLALCVAFSFQGSRGLYETTEGRYAEVGREMVVSGDWMVPHLDGQPHWTKPPLTYWCIGAGVAAFGRNAWAARLYDAIVLVAATVMVASLGATLWDEITGLIAGMMFVTFPFVVVGANVVSPDMLLAGWELLAVVCFWRATRSVDRRARQAWITGMWTAFGFAFLTKGPPGILPLGAILLYGILERRRGTAPPLVTIPGLLLFLIVGLGWYLFSVARDPSLAGYFLGKEIWGRVATGMHHRNSQWFMPVVIFGPPLLLGAGAWLVTAIRDARAAGGMRWLVRSASSRAESRFLVIWLAFPLLVFCLSRSRLPLYVLPLAPAIALAFARLAVHAATPARALGRSWRIALVSAVVLVAGKGVSAHLSSRQNMLPLAREIRARAPDRVTVVDHHELYGLQFYLDGELRRCRSTDIRGELSDMRDRFEAGSTRRELLILARGVPEILAGECADGRVSCTITTVSEYPFYVVQPGDR